jgi:hypothetical protein
MDNILNYSTRRPFSISMGMSGAEINLAAVEYAAIGVIDQVKTPS